MVNIAKNDIITMNRGDSLSLDFFVNLTTSHDSPKYLYSLTAEDALYFGVMGPRHMFEEAIIRKKYTSKNLNSNGSITIGLNPQDTLNLEPGIYYYEIKMKTPVGVRTLVTKKKLIIEE